MAVSKLEEMLEEMAGDLEESRLMHSEAEKRARDAEERARWAEHRAEGLEARFDPRGPSEANP